MRLTTYPIESAGQMRTLIPPTLTTATAGRFMGAMARLMDRWRKRGVIHLRQGRGLFVDGPAHTPLSAFADFLAPMEAE